MKKTVLQELIEKIKLLKPLEGKIDSIDVISFMAENMIEKEKEQIAKAYNIGKHDALDSIQTTSEEYYNKNFN